MNDEFEKLLKEEREKVEGVVLSAMKAAVDAHIKIELKLARRWFGSFSPFAYRDNFALEKAEFAMFYTTQILKCLRETWGDKEGAEEVAKALKAARGG